VSGEEEKWSNGCSAVDPRELVAGVIEEKGWQKGGHRQKNKNNEEEGGGYLNTSRKWQDSILSI
jgi:hypothetical protein